MRPRKTKTLVINDAVRRLREGYQMTQEEFARKKLQTAHITLARYETTRIPPSVMLDRMRKLADDLGPLDLSDLFYSALVQESRVHRSHMALSMKAKIREIAQKLKDLRNAVDSDKVSASCNEILEDLFDLYRCALIVDPEYTRSELGDGYSDQVARMLKDERVESKHKRGK